MQDLEQNSATLSADGAELKGKYLTFWTDSQLYGVPIADVVQIVSMQAITAVPGYPYYTKGIINLRGTIIPIIDIRLRLGKAETEHTDRTCIIVTNLGSQLIGFIVDAVDEVTYIDDEAISAPPQMDEYSSAGNEYISGIGKRENLVIVLLDTKRVLMGNQLELLSAE